MDEISRSRLNRIVSKAQKCIAEKCRLLMGIATVVISALMKVESCSQTRVLPKALLVLCLSMLYIYNIYSNQ